MAYRGRKVFKILRCNNNNNNPKTHFRSFGLKFSHILLKNFGKISHLLNALKKFRWTIWWFVQFSDEGRMIFDEILEDR